MLGWPPGVYWIDSRDCTLSVTMLPRWRGDALIDMEPAEGTPTWYLGPAVYTLNEAGIWVAFSAPGGTLDEFLQTYDPLPRPQ